MTTANGSVRLADADKKRLKTTVLELRRLVEGDLARELKRLGIDPGRDAALPAEKLPYLTEAERAARRGLDAALLRERAAGGGFAAAVEAVRREAAYTHLNRLIGLKCLELRGHLRIEGGLTETITCRPEYGGRPRWLWTLREREGRYRFGEDAEELLWREGLTQACAAVTQEIRVLFDPSDLYAQAWPSHKALREAVDRLNALPDDVFRADELLGWVYQYFQSEEKDRVFEAARTQKKKISGPNIIPVTQLYTERYMVDFLLQNSLGALWMEMYPDSNLKAEWPYYVTPATPHTRPRRPVREWTLLDPCAGSGHFLVVAFELFLRLYAEERWLAEAGVIPADWAVPEHEVAATILERNLHGIDIDPRAVQLATLALYLKAKEAGLARSPRINIVAADASFLRGEAWARFLESLKDEPGLQKILAQMAESLADIREIGSLLRPEVELQRIVREVHGEWETKGRRKAEQALLFPELAAGMQLKLPLEALSDEQFWELMARRAEQEIHRCVDAARGRGEAVDQVVAGEAERGFAFLDLCRRRYDVVCTNPPYMNTGSMSDVLKRHVTLQYPQGKRDLYSSFILRCRELADVSGHVAMVTQESWMFLRNFVGLRAAPSSESDNITPVAHKGLLRISTITALAHLGPNAFSEISGEVVRVVMFVLQNTQPADNNRITAFRLTGLKTPAEKATMLRAAIADSAHPVRNVIGQATLASLPLSPLSYWLGPGFLAVLRGRLIGDVATVVRQVITSNNERFLRYSWETTAESGWLPYAKSGGYARWHGFEQLRIDWTNDGATLKEYISQKFPYLKGNTAWLVKEDTFFKQGWTYTRMARGCLCVRVMSGQRLFDNSSPVIVPAEGASPSGLGVILNSRFSSFLLRALTTDLTPNETYIARLPAPELPKSLLQMEKLAVELKQWLNQQTPTEDVFEDVPFPDFQAVSLQHLLQSLLLTVEGLVETDIVNAFGLGQKERDQALAETGTPADWYPLIDGFAAVSVPALLQASEPLADALALVTRYVQQRARLAVAAHILADTQNQLRAAYQHEAEPKDLDGKGETEDETGEEEGDKEGEADAGVTVGAYVPIPFESRLEGIVNALKIHPLSVYWLLEKLRREEGLVCPPELRRQTEDYFSVKLLRMLGHRWPMQDQYEQEQGRPFLDPQWLDEDGIMPLTPGTGDVVLADRFARFLDAEFGETRGHAVEVEAGQILGWKSGDEWGKQKPTTLARWFEREFFRRHVSQFKRRPIAWHLSSPRGAFQTIVYYHKFDKNRLALLRARYVRNVIEGLRHELAKTAGAGQNRETLSRVAVLEAQLADVQEFDARLQRLQEGRDREARIWCPWKAPAEQPVGWDPDINDGVRVNIAPVQRLGLLAADVLAAKDVKSLLAPEGRGSE